MLSKDVGVAVAEGVAVVDVVVVVKDDFDIIVVEVVVKLVDVVLATVELTVLPATDDLLSPIFIFLSILGTKDQPYSNVVLQKKER